MALTRVTQTVVASNAFSADKLANNSIQSRHLSDLSVELRHLASSANTVTNLNGLQTNINSVQGNVVAQRTNVNTVSTNAASAAANSIQNKANVDTALANVIQLNANINVVSSNVDAVEARRVANLASVTFSGQVNMSDDLIVAGNLIVNGDTTTANSVNMIVQDRMIMLANSATGSPAADIGLLFNRGNQGNAAFFYDESAQTFKVADTKDPSSNTTLSPVTLANLAVGKLSFDGADLNTAITDNRSGAISTVYATNLTASRALTSDSSGKIAVATPTTTELNYVSGVTGALQTQIDAKDSVANVHATFVRLNANINTTTANINVVQDNVAVLGGGGTFFDPFMNVNTATGTSNVFFTGKDTAEDANVLTVTLDGIVQANTEFVMNHSNNTIQFKDASIPSGTVVTILTMT